MILQAGRNNIQVRKGLIANLIIVNTTNHKKHKNLYFTATVSISTITLNGNSLTAKAARAGGFSG